MSNTVCTHARMRGKTQNVIDFLWWINGNGPLIYNNIKREWDETVHKFVIRILEKGSWESGFVGRCGYDGSEVRYKIIGDEMLVDFLDSCAWSISGSMMGTDGECCEQKGITELTRIYDIRMEIYGEETGEGFDEHYKFFGRYGGEPTDDDGISHDDVREKIESEGWEYDDRTDQWKRRNPTDRRKWEKYDSYALFSQFKDRMFPWDFDYDIGLEGEDWVGVGSKEFYSLRLLDFMRSHPNSWGGWISKEFYKDFPEKVAPMAPPEGAS